MDHKKKFIMIILVALAVFVLGFFINVPEARLGTSGNNVRVRYNLNSEDIYLRRTSDYIFEIFNRDRFVKVRFDNILKDSLDLFLQSSFNKIEDTYYLNELNCKGISLVIDPNNFNNEPDFIKLDTIECIN